MRTPLNRLESAFPGKAQVRNFGRSEGFVVEVDFGSFGEVAAWVRMEESFRLDFLETLTAFEAKGKLVLTYFLRSHASGFRIALRTSVGIPGGNARATVPSMIGEWPHVEAFESELGPLFGIDFVGARGAGGVRKNFGNFGGFPLRKSFEWREDLLP